MDYRCAATSVGGFIQQLAVSYVGRGYWFYVTGVIPERIRWRTSKLGFATPERSWQRSVLRRLLDETLGDCRLEEFILVDRAREYQAKVEEMGLTDFTSWRWINLHLWTQAFGV